MRKTTDIRLLETEHETLNRLGHTVHLYNDPSQRYHLACICSARVVIDSTTYRVSRNVAAYQECPFTRNPA